MSTMEREKLPQDKKASFVYFCPECSSAAVDYSELDGGNASCRNCNWSGSMDQLYAHPFIERFGESEETIRAMVTDLRNLMAKDLGLPLIRFFMKWGFIESPDSKTVSKYLAALAQAFMKAAMETRSTLEKR